MKKLQAQFPKHPTSPASYDLNENILDIPLKKSKRINEFLQREQKNKQTHNKIYKKPEKNPSDEESQTFNLQDSDSKFCNYIMGCIMRVFASRKFSVEDISEIFKLKPDLVEGIEKLKILNDFSDGISNPKLESMKSDVLKRLEESFQGFNTSLKNPYKDIKWDFPQHPRKNRSGSMKSHKSVIQEEEQEVLERSNLNQNNRQKTQIFEHVNKFPPKNPQKELQFFNDGVQEYQRLLRERPPHKLDDKMKAIIEILKGYPNATQKDMLRVLQQNYGIQGITQTTLSRMIKKIYIMEEKCNIIKKAAAEGKVDISA